MVTIEKLVDSGGKTMDTDCIMHALQHELFLMVTMVEIHTDSQCLCESW